MMSLLRLLLPESQTDHVGNSEDHDCYKLLDELNHPPDRRYVLEGLAAWDLRGDIESLTCLRRSLSSIVGLRGVSSVPW